MKEEDLTEWLIHSELKGNFKEGDSIEFSHEEDEETGMFVLKGTIKTKELTTKEVSFSISYEKKMIQDKEAWQAELDLLNRYTKTFLEALVTT